MVSLPSLALPIILKKSTGKQHGGSRTSSPVLVADLNDHEIELTVNRYEGVAHIYMYDATHTVMLCDTLQVSGKNQVVTIALYRYQDFSSAFQFAKVIYFFNFWRIESPFNSILLAFATKRSIMASAKVGSPM